MVSYLSLFRRYQKPLLAGLGVFAMLGFVVFPILQDFLMTRQQVGEPVRKVVARFDGGELSYAAIENYRLQHARSVQFLDMMAREVIKRGGVPRVPGFRANPQNNQIFSLGIPAVLSEQGVISSKLGAIEAGKLGLTVNREFVDEWLKAFNDSRLTGAEIDAMFREATGGELQKTQFYNVMTTELAAGLVGRIGYGGMATGRGDILSPPGQLWDDFRKVAETARVTAFPVLVADFIDKVPNDFPDNEIRALYEEGRERFPDPDSPEPGFRRRYSADVEFVRVAMQPFVDQAKNALTEEAVRAEYDRQVAEGLWRTAIETPPSTPETPATTEASEPTADGSQATTDSGNAPEVPATATELEPQTPPSDDAAESAESEPAAGPVNAEPSQSPPAEERPVEGPPADPKPEVQAASSGLGDGVQLVTFQEEQPRAESPADAAASDPQLNAGEGGAPDAAATDTAPVEDPRELDTETGTQTAPPAMPGLTPSTRVQSFEEVKDQVREQMALQPARDAMKQVIDRVRKEMRGFAQKQARYQALKRETGEAESPEPLDLAGVARAVGAEHGRTGNVDAVSVDSQPISRAASFTDMGFMRFSQMVFNPDIGEFQIQEAQDFADGATYVFWKTASKADYTPELSEVRDEVVAFLRLRAARELARKEAESLAKQANEQPDRPIAELIPENRIALLQSEVGPFSWYTLVSQLNGQPVISEVPQLDRVGDEFMRAVFGDQRDQWLVAGNAPLNTYYVLRGSDFQPSIEELQKQFRETGRRLAGTAVGQDRVSALYRAWQRSITDRMKLELEPL